MQYRTTEKHPVLQIPMDPEGFEPSTSSMPLRRAPNCAMGPYLVPAGAGIPSRPNGPGGIRTRDLFSAIEARSHCATGPGFWVAELYLSDLCLSRKAIFIGFPKFILIATLYILCQTFLTLTPDLCYSSLVRRIVRNQLTIWLTMPA